MAGYRFTTLYLAGLAAKQRRLEYAAWLKDVEADHQEKYPLRIAIPTSTGCRIEDADGTVLEEVDYEKGPSGY